MGFSDIDTSIAGKWMEILKEAASFFNRVTVLHDPDQRNHQPFLRVINTTAVPLKMQVSTVGVRDRGEIEQAIAALGSEKNQGVVVLPGPVNKQIAIGSTNKSLSPGDLSTAPGRRGPTHMSANIVACARLRKIPD